MSWRMFDPHLIRLADSLAFDNDGNRIASSSAMMPMTTSSSTSVKPRRAPDVRGDVGSFHMGGVVSGRV
jgi:hypothetical protein